MTLATDNQADPEPIMHNLCILDLAILRPLFLQRHLDGV